MAKTGEIKPALHVLGGPNGAGKTTFARVILPLLGVTEYLNADLIAAGLTPLDPAASSIRAGRILLDRLRYLFNEKRGFAFETTLSGRTYLPMLERARSSGFYLSIHYLWVSSPKILLSRIRNRVRKGGHHVPEADVRRRFTVGLKHFFHDYLPIADEATLWNVSSSPVERIATWNGGIPIIIQGGLYETIRQKADQDHTHT